MVKEIIWTGNAENDLLNVINYLKYHWSETAADKFLSILFNKINLLSLQPRLGRKTSFHRAYRRFMITRHNVLIYSVHRKHLVIHRLKDTRQKK
jgi:plasmid stabilization system protein ParE